MTPWNIDDMPGLTMTLDDLMPAWLSYGGSMTYDQFKETFCRRYIYADITAREAALERHNEFLAALGMGYGGPTTPPLRTAWPYITAHNHRCATGDDMKKVKHRRPNKARTLNHCVIVETVIPGRNIDRTWLVDEKGPSRTPLRCCAVRSTAATTGSRSCSWSRSCASSRSGRPRSSAAPRARASSTRRTSPPAENRWGTPAGGRRTMLPRSMMSI